jgi:hypothetical protein
LYGNTLSFAPLRSVVNHFQGREKEKRKTGIGTSVVADA